LQYPDRPGLGNLGTDSYSLIPELDDDPRIGYRPGLPRNPYAFSNSEVPAYDVRYPVTKMEYSMGTKEEQFFRITHTQNIEPEWNVGVSYRKFGSTGLYRRQKSNFGNFHFSTNYRHPDGYYQGKLAYQADRSRLQQNGGISDPEAFEENLRGSRETFRIRLSNASSRSRYDRIQLKHSLFPGGRSFLKDTSEHPEFGVFHRASFRNTRSFYRDGNPLSAFYERTILDSVETRDKMILKRFGNRVGLLLQERKKGRGGSEARVGFRHHFIRNRLLGKGEAFQDGVIFLKGTHQWKGQLIQARLAYGAMGYGEGDRSVSACWQREEAVEGVADSLALSVNYKERQPAYLHQNYRSNHFSWDRSLPSPKILEARARWGEPREREGVSVSHTRIGDAIYYGTDARPRSAEEELALFRTQLRQRFRVGKWGAELYGVWQKEWNTDILRLPEFYLRGGIFFETPLFDRALKARFGARCTYYSSYRGHAYMPATRRFYLQNEERIGDYPFIDLYFQGRKGDILFFVELDHGNAGLMGYGYYGAPHYPLRDRTVRLGFKWNLFN
jgi:hypothetical protein